jgi:hypothetical protein
MRSHGFLLGVALALAGCNVDVSTTPPPQLPPATPGTAAQRDEAFQAAKAIVKALDRGEFEQVWESSSGILKRSTHRLAFTSLMSGTRGILGQPAPRGAPRIGFARQIDPGLPEGDYAVIEVDTDFAGTTVAEKIVLARESGQWKLAGYFMNTGTEAQAREQ